MGFLLDSNVLLPLVFEELGEHDNVRAAYNVLLARGETCYYASQNLGEFWNVTTRPSSARGGLGLSLEVAEREAEILERMLTLLPDGPAVHARWRRLLVEHAVTGAQVHDARLAALMLVHQVEHILTFDARHFARFPGVVAVHPAQVS